MDQTQSTTKAEINAARTKAIEAIQSAIPELPTNELVQLAMVAITYRRFANYQSWFEKGAAILAPAGGNGNGGN